MTSLSENAIELSFGSCIEYLELIDIVTEAVTKLMGFDEDSAYWINMSVHEGVANAIRHGNQLAADKKVDVRYEIDHDQLSVSVRDQGAGFDAGSLPDPLDPQNLLKPSGRGIFYMKSFMDEVEFRPLEQGMEVRMKKKLNLAEQS